MADGAEVVEIRTAGFLQTLRSEVPPPATKADDDQE
jgi:hypothetical protein